MRGTGLGTVHDSGPLRARGYKEDQKLKLISKLSP